MRKEADVKYPNSANLFRLCRRVLDHKYGGIRVIDQDVGQILSFDPADCSHWKKGKKNVRSIQAMKNIADHLGIDEKLVVDVATGEISENEAFSEYNGYGAFTVEQSIFDSAKKDYYRKNAGTWTKDKEIIFKTFFIPNEITIDKIVRNIHQDINYNEAPLYLPEIIAVFPEITLSGRPDFPQGENKPAIKVTSTTDRTDIQYKIGTETQPYMRFVIAKAIGAHFLARADDIPAKIRSSTGDLEPYAAHMQDIETNLFAIKLLAPALLVKREMGNLNVAKDVVSQLADSFWVSKIFMNFRLKSLLQLNSDNPNAL